MQNEYCVRYSVTPKQRKSYPVHQNFSMIKQFSLIGALYIEIITGSHDSQLRPSVVWLCRQLLTMSDHLSFADYTCSLALCNT